MAETDPGPSGPEDTEMAARVARLSAGQLACLRLVNEHRSSKEIASALGISSHTVDQRIRGALETLQVERRAQAARIVAQFDLSKSRRSAGSESEDDDVGLELAGPSRRLISLPFALSDASENRMSAGQRLLWIVMIAILASFSAGIFMAGIESVSRLVKN